MGPPPPRQGPCTALKIGAEALLARAHAPPPSFAEKAAGARSGIVPELASLAASASAETAASSTHLRHTKVYGGNVRSERRQLAEFRALLVERCGSLGDAWHLLLDRDVRGKLFLSDFSAACAELGWPGSARTLFNELDTSSAGCVQLADLLEPPPLEASSAVNGGDEGQGQGRGEEESDEALRALRMFFARARRCGPAGLPRLARTLGCSASAGGRCFDEQAFIKCCLAQGLGLGVEECRSVFRQLASTLPDAGSQGQQQLLLQGSRASPAAGGVAAALVDVGALMDRIRGRLSPGRSAAVREVWSQLDVEGRGCVDAHQLLARFDARWLPAVRYGETPVDVAQCQLLEGLGQGAGGMAPLLSVADATKTHPCTLEKAMARQRLTWARPPPGGAWDAPAGKPREPASRARGDVAKELAAQAPAVHADGPVTAADFVAYYTAVSTATPQDDLFFRVLRDPWVGHHRRQEAVSHRESHSARRAQEVPSRRKVLATFHDGSSRLVTLYNDVGLNEQSLRAGGGSCPWGFGDEVLPEVLRRLHEQGEEGIAKVKLVSD